MQPSSPPTEQIARAPDALDYAHRAQCIKADIQALIIPYFLSLSHRVPSVVTEEWAGHHQM
jgi:hypothetical protein